MKASEVVTCRGVEEICWEEANRALDKGIGDQSLEHSRMIHKRIYWGSERNNV